MMNEGMHVRSGAELTVAGHRLHIRMYALCSNKKCPSSHRFVSCTGDSASNKGILTAAGAHSKINNNAFLSSLSDYVIENMNPSTVCDV
jgi:hypothetical protein